MGRIEVLVNSLLPFLSWQNFVVVPIGQLVAALQPTEMYFQLVAKGLILSRIAVEQLDLLFGSVCHRCLPRLLRRLRTLLV